MTIFTNLLVILTRTGVLVAISIPIFTAQLEKSREATDAANIRSAYAEVMANAVSGETAASKLTKNVVLKQQTTSWQNTFDFPSNLAAGTTAPGKSVTATVTYNASGSKKDTASINIKLK